MQRGHRSRDRRTDRRTNNFVSILSTRNDNGGGGAGPDKEAAEEIWGGFWVSARQLDGAVRPAALRTEASSFTLSQECDFSGRVRLHTWKTACSSDTVGQ